MKYYNAASNKNCAESTDLCPHVREADASKRQAARLTPIDKPFKKDTKFLSSIYLLTEEQKKRNESIENPYAVRGYTCIAQAIVDECEHDQRVLHQLFVESDDKSVLPAEQKECILKFIREDLDISPSECELWYSGGKSVHAHVPYLCDNEKDLEAVKKLAERFNETSEIPLDISIYSSGRQFRLPWVPYTKGGFVKFRIEEDWDTRRILQEGDRTQKRFNRPKRPETPREYIEGIYGMEVSELIRKAIAGDSDVLYRPREANMPVTSDGGAISIKEGPKSVRKGWPEYYPYANFQDDGYPSIAVLCAKSEPYIREDDGKEEDWIDAEAIAIIGCLDEYRVEPHKADRFRRVKLAKRYDMEKLREMEVQEGDYIILMSQWSGRSKIIRVNEDAAKKYAVILSRDGRKRLLQELKADGYDIRTLPRDVHKGKTGPTSPVTGQNTQKLLKRAEEDGIEEGLNHRERCNLANGLLLTHGWKGTGKILKQLFGDEFKPELTYKFLVHIAKSYDNLPPKPSYEEFYQMVDC